MLSTKTNQSLLQTQTSYHAAINSKKTLHRHQSIKSQSWATRKLNEGLSKLSDRQRISMRAIAKPEAITETKAIAEPEALPAAEPPKQKQGYADAIMMQGFGWESCKQEQYYKHLTSLVDDLKGLGISHLWLPPPSQSVSPQGYMPGQLYNLTTKYGDQAALVELIQKLKDAGIYSMADIVINHRCADEMIDGVYNKFRDDTDHEGRRIDWGKWAITGNDPAFKGQGNADTGADFEPAPDLDHANPELRAALREWLGWLQKDIGFAGFRFDFVKGYSAEFTKEYVDATTSKDALNVGEFWEDMRWNGGELEANQDGPRQVLCDWIDKSGQRCPLFDFPTKGILQEAAKNVQYWRLRDANGKAPGLIGWMPTMAVTFVDNHDTGSTERHWPFADEQVGAGYAYILSHPGIPCLFIEHWTTWGDELKSTLGKLVAMRRRNGIRSDSKLEILCADADMYVARIDDKVMVKLGPRGDMGTHYPRPEDGWSQVASGKDFAVWDKTSGQVSADKTSAQVNVDKTSPQVSAEKITPQVSAEKTNGQVSADKTNGQENAVLPN